MLLGKSKDDIVCPNCKHVLGTYDVQKVAWIEAKCDECGGSVLVKVKDARHGYEAYEVRRSE